MYDFHCHLITDNAYFCKKETMIDKRYPDVPLQAELAKKELIENKKSNRVSTLHCVRSTELMMNILKEVKPLPKTVLWHSFNGSRETAEELYKLGIIISISPKCTKNIKELVTANPLFALETDYTGTSREEHFLILKNHYINVAKLLNISVEELEKRCIENAVAFTV